MKSEPSRIFSALRSKTGLSPSLIIGSNVMGRRSFLRGLSLTSLLCVCGNNLHADPNCSTCQRIASLNTQIDNIVAQTQPLAADVVQLEGEISDLQAIIDDPESTALAVLNATTSKQAKTNTLNRKNSELQALGDEAAAKSAEVESLTNHPCPPVTGHWETRETWIVTGSEWVVTGGSWQQGEYLGLDEFDNPIYGPDQWVESGEWQETGYWHTEEVWVEDMA